MTVFEWLACISGCMYGGLSVIGGVMQFRNRVLPIWSGICMIVLGGAITFCVINILFFGGMISFLVISLILMHIIAIINGLHIYGKINFAHHFIRLVLSIIIIYPLL